MDNFWNEFVGNCSRSISEMQKLKADILKGNLFEDVNERAEVLLLIDHIIWEEIHNARAGREEHRKHVLAIADLAKSIQERESRSEPIPGG